MKLKKPKSAFGENSNPPQVTPEMVALYKRIVEADENADTRDDHVTLHAMLGRKIWQYSIFGIDLDSETPPDFVIRAGDFRIKDWMMARDLARELHRCLDAEEA